MISDHAGADRNSDGIDAAGVFNALMGSPSIFGITYNDNSADSTFGWFDDHPDGNFTTDTSSPIIWTGAFGVPSSTQRPRPVRLTSMTLTGAAKGHIWKTTSTHDTSTGVTYATSTYGTGRVAAIGDSSITEDATNSCGHTTYLGYNDPSYDNGLLVANGVAWLANGTAAAAATRLRQRSSITAPSNGATVVGTISINATASDNVGVTKVEFYVDGALKITDTTSPYSYSWDSTAVANGSHSLTAKAYDAAHNVGTPPPSPSPSTIPPATDVSGWTVTQANATVVYTIPAGTAIPANGYVVIGRDATKAAFQTFWGVTLASNVVYLTTAGAFPQINGSENYTLKNAQRHDDRRPDDLDALQRESVDLQRIDPCTRREHHLATGTSLATTTATPGTGAGAGCAKGVVINEFSDAAGTGNFVYEFVELHNDK